MAIKKTIELEVKSSGAVTGLNKTSDALGKVGKSSKGVATGFKGIGTAMKAMGLGILIGLLSAVFEAFKKNQKAQDLMARGFDLLQRVVGVVVDVFMAALSVVDALTFGMFNLADASDTASASLQRQRNEVRLLQAQEQLITLEFQQQAETQRQIRDDESKTIEERKQANIELGNILDNQFKVETANANKALSVAEQELKLDEHNIELQERVINAKTKVAEINERITGQRSEQLVNINSLNRENRELRNTTGGVTTAIKEQVKSYEDLNSEMETALGLDRTVEGITKQIADAHTIRAEQIKKEEEELEKLINSEKTYRASKANTLDLDKKSIDITIATLDAEKRLSDFKRDLRFGTKEQQDRAKINIFSLEQTIENLKEERRINNEAIAQREADNIQGNKKRKNRVINHNNELEIQLREHFQLIEDNEHKHNQLIAEARQMAREELDYFLGTDREKELLDLKEEFDKRMLMVEGDLESQLRLQDWFGQQLMEINKRYDDEEFEAYQDQKQRLEDEEQSYQDFIRVGTMSSLDQQLADLKANFEEQMIINKNYTEAKLEIEKAYLRKKQELIDQDAKSERAKNVEDLRKTLGMAAGLYEKGTKKWKRLKIAESIISGGTAVIKSLELPFPLNLLQAAVVAGITRQNIKQIQDTEVTGNTDQDFSVNAGGGLSSISEGLAPNLPTDSVEMPEQEPIQAFVVESDVTSSQSLQEDLELQATL
tara:strand:+ start:6929 stop:9085 length:2157 start_codon:yes stop_codon:yes gene_type:complete